jgi:hypothetical protein
MCATFKTCKNEFRDWILCFQPGDATPCLMTVTEKLPSRRSFAAIGKYTAGLGRNEASTVRRTESVSNAVLQINTEFQTEIPKERCHLRDLGVNGRIILKIVLTKYAVRVWTGFIWLRMALNSGVLLTWSTWSAGSYLMSWATISFPRRTLPNGIIIIIIIIIIITTTTITITIIINCYRPISILNTFSNIF